MRARKAFQERAREAMADAVLQGALDRNAARRRGAWETAFASLPRPVEALRGQARAVRWGVVEHLEDYLSEFVEKVEANGVQVHRAADGEEAAQVVVALARQHGVRLVAKSKSMVSEEIELNGALERSGIGVVETDLGEYIVQLRGERPTHIITPAVHLRREDVAETFADKLGMPYSTDVEVMNETARTQLRETFLSAEVGVSGVNFGVVETGTLCLVTNEGNGRMVTTLPPVHIAVMGVERLVPTLEDLTLMLQLLPRSATGQKITSYVTLLNGARGKDEPDGPNVRHLVLVDNGRLRMAESSMAEALLCIRCGACLNACPVYQEVGGKAYDSVYPGPIGALVSPGLFGVQAYGHLSKASTLCGACVEACPVQIDFPTLLLRGRRDYVESAPQPVQVSLGMRLYAWVMASPRRYRLAGRAVAWGQGVLPKREGWLRWLPGPLAAWTRARHFPPLARKPFRARWEALDQNGEQLVESGVSGGKGRQTKPTTEPPNEELVDRFEAELDALGGEVVRVARDDLPEVVLAHLREMKAEDVLAWGPEPPLFDSLLRYLHAGGIRLLDPELPGESNEDEGEARGAKLAELGAAQVGLTGAVAGLADTGTLVVPSGRRRSQLASLLPPVHFALLPVDHIHAGMAEWLADGGKNVVAESTSVALISGPSRTADIEMTLTIGVHGPGKVVVFCY